MQTSWILLKNPLSQCRWTTIDLSIIRNVVKSFWPVICTLGGPIKVPHTLGFAMDVVAAGVMYAIFDFEYIQIILMECKMCIQHACYDGTISMAMMFFVLLSLAEMPEPDWSESPKYAPVASEISFELDDHLREEVQRVRTQVYAEVTLNTNVYF